MMKLHILQDILMTYRNMVNTTLARDKNGAKNVMGGGFINVANMSVKRVIMNYD